MKKVIIALLCIAALTLLSCQDSISKEQEFQQKIESIQSTSLQTGKTVERTALLKYLIETGQLDTTKTITIDMHRLITIEDSIQKSISIE